jgi:hypothetical protein
MKVTQADPVQWFTDLSEKPICIGTVNSHAYMGWPSVPATD